MVVVLALVLTRPSPEPWHLEVTPGPKFRVTNQITRVSDEPVTAWEAIAAAPPDLNDQRISKRELFVDNRLVLKPEVRESSPAQVSVLATEFTAKDIGHRDPVTVKAVYEGQMFKVALVPGASARPVADLPDHERALCLAETVDINWKSPAVQEFIDKAGLRLKAGEGVVEFGRRVYRHIRQTMKYRADAPFDGQPCSADIKAMVGHCGNYSRLAVAVFRANGIPARIQFGQWVDKPGTYKDGSPHTRAHFWAPGVGWVLCDTSIGIPVGGWKPERDLDVGFGSTRNHFLAFHIHGWLQVPTRRWGPQKQTHLQFVYMPAEGGTWERSRYDKTLVVEFLS